MDNDIVLLLYRIKVNIRKVESGNREVLNAITEDYLQLMELLKLFLISERETYYGYFLMNMTFQVDYKSEIIAGVKLNQYPPVFMANPLLYCKFSLKEIIFIACHEIEHLILNHPAEMVKANPTRNPDIYRRFNYAADASVNDRLIHDIALYKIRYMSFPEGCIDSQAFAKTFGFSNIRSNESYQYYYDLIKHHPCPRFDSVSMALQNANQKNEGQTDGESSNLFSQPDENQLGEGPGENGEVNSSSSGQLEENQLGEGPGENGEVNGSSSGQLEENQLGGGTREDGEGNDNSSGHSEENQPGESENSGKKEESSDDGIVTADKCRDPGTHEWDTTADAEAAQELTKEFVNDVVDMMSQKTRGNMPAGFIAQVRKLNEKPHIRWEQVLKKYAGTITAGQRKTRMRLNRRQPERFDLSGKMEDKTLKIVVAIDTSGSVSDNEISAIFNEIFEILSKKKFEMTIIECDAIVQHVYRVKTRKDVQTSVRGRGGTFFTPVIEYINKDKYFRDALLIYFTDGFGETKIPKPRTYRNMWVITGGGYLSVENPYGIVIKM